MATHRFPEIDFFRSLALILMIVYHLVYDLDTWSTINIDVDSIHWFIIGKTSALLFIFLSGVSLGFSRNSFKNGLKVLFWALVITFVTWLVMPEQYVRFGILHFLGSIMIVYPLIKNIPNPILLILSGLTLILGFYLRTKIISTPFFIPLGLRYNGFSTIDYYPIFPYCSVSLLGIIFYRLYYQNKTKPKSYACLRNLYIMPLFRNISKHSLKIYLIHQPILISIIYIINKIICKT